MAMDSSTVAALNERHAGASAEEILRAGLGLDPDRTILACSLGIEDTVLLHMLVQETAKMGKKARGFVLDTGRLPEESYGVLEDCRQKYGAVLEVFFPDAHGVENLLREKGPYSFYESIENRKECCRIRKVEPLKRALSGQSAWITGLRKEQAATRADTPLFELDETHGGILKINPLANWTEQMVYDYALAHNVPVNALHRKSYPSIGCEPCTRAVQPGEDLRAGRWWWENAAQKECGLHVKEGI